MNSTQQWQNVTWFEVDEHQDGQRIDNFLFSRLKGVPKSRIYRLIREGQVRVNKKRIKAETKLAIGDQIRVAPIRYEQKDETAAPVSDKVAQSLLSRVVYEDEGLMVVNKPSGIAVHGGSGVAYGLIEGLRAATGKKYLELIHRIDRDTSGLVMISKKRSTLKNLQDLLRERSEDWPWVFDAEMAARPCAFAELLPHIKGKWAREGRLIELEDWQCFILTTVFGWVHHETRLRRFLEAYEEEARKNGKSAKGSALLLYMLAADGEHGAECYTAATTRDQARIVFDDAKAMAERSPGLRTHLGVAIMQHSLTVAHTSSKAAPLAAEGSTLDGLNVHFALLDELHAHKTRAVYDVIDSARGAREQSLLWTITTAGTDRSGICYERRTHLTKVLDRVVDDHSIFGIIYSIDDADDPFVEASWAKANPNWDVSVLRDDMEGAARKAEIMPSALNNFLTKRLNVWVSGETSWMDMRAWERCADRSLQISDFAGEPVGRFIKVVRRLHGQGAAGRQLLDQVRVQRSVVGQPLQRGISKNQIECLFRLPVADICFHKQAVWQSTARFSNHRRR